MVSLFGWLKKKEDIDYDKVLDEIAVGIRECQLELSTINQQKRARISKFLLTSIPSYLLTSLVFLLNAIDFKSQLYCCFVILGGLIIIVQSRKLIDIWFERQRRIKLELLEKLQAQQQIKVEELKRKTSYYITKGLIERYETTPTKILEDGSELRQRAPNQTPVKSKQQQPQQGPILKQESSPNPNRLPQQQSVQKEELKPLQLNISQKPPEPIKYTWVDRILDLIIGEQEGPHQKYALICEQCFEHNGLCPPQEYHYARKSVNRIQM